MSSERWYGHHRFTSLESGRYDLGFDVTCTSHDGTPLAPIPSSPLSSLDEDLASSQAPRLQCPWGLPAVLFPMYLPGQN